MALLNTVNLWITLACVAVFLCLANECDVEIERENLCVDKPKDRATYCVMITGKTLVMSCIERNVKVSLNR